MNLLLNIRLVLAQALVLAGLLLPAAAAEAVYPIGSRLGVVPLPELKPAM